MIMQNRVAEARQTANLSQAKLAELSGVPRRTIQDWEAQKFEPSAYRLYKVAKVLGCSMDDLIIDDETE